MSFPDDSLVDTLPANSGRLRRHEFNPWVGKNPGEGNGNQLQYPCLGNPRDRGAWGLPSMGSPRVRHD